MNGIKIIQEGWWQDTEFSHKEINEIFKDCVDQVPQLKELRDWVETNIWGFGERSFYWMWKLIVDEMPQEFTFMEIGVFRGQILALIKLLANLSNKKVNIVGLSPMTSEGGYWESDYERDVETIFDKFNLEKDYTIIKEDSRTRSGIGQAYEYNQELDILYIDGGHEYNTVKSDISEYTRFIKPNGFLVMDDCATKFNLPNGYFRGHEEVSKAVDEVLPPFTKNENFTHLFNVVHNRVWRKNM